MFKIAKKMGMTNQDIIGEQCIRNNYVLLVGIDEEKKIAWKSYHESLFNIESLHEVEIVCLRQIQLPWYLHQ